MKRKKPTSVTWKKKVDEIECMQINLECKLDNNNLYLFSIDALNYVLSKSKFLTKLFENLSINANIFEKEIANKHFYICKQFKYLTLERF